MSRQRVILLGATGQIGVFAIPRLVSAGFDVVAVSRKGKPAWYPELEGVEWIRLEALESGAVGRADMLVSAGPIRIATGMISRCAGLKRAVIFSTSSVFSKLESHDRRERRNMQQILMDEAELSHACEAQGITLSLYRPTLIYGCGIDGNVSWLAKWIRKFGIVPIAGEASGLRQPVHADDLAAAAVTTLASDKPLALDVPLCGGSILSFREMIEAIFRALDKPVRIVSIPKKLFTTITYVSRLVPKLRGVRPEMVRREGKDLVFDDSTPREVLGYDPRPFAPGPAEFSLPSADWIRRAAQPD